MTTKDYQRAAAELRRFRADLYEWKVRHGLRLSLSEASFLLEQRLAGLAVVAIQAARAAAEVARRMNELRASMETGHRKFFRMGGLLPRR